jgi:membrane associated rhomboid family serine protease
VLLALGFFFPFIDNWGHLGGLVGGYVVGTLVALVQGVQRLAVMRAGTWAGPKPTAAAESSK